MYLVRYSTVRYENCFTQADQLFFNPEKKCFFIPLYRYRTDLLYLVQFYFGTYVRMYPFLVNISSIKIVSFCLGSDMYRSYGTVRKSKKTYQ